MASRSASANTTAGALPPSSRCTRLAVSAAAAITARPVAEEPVTETMSRAGVRDEGGADVGATGDDVEHAGRESGLGRELGEPDRRARSRRRRLEHHGVPGSERGADLPDPHDEREVPGRDAAHHAHRASQQHRGVARRREHRRRCPPASGQSRRRSAGCPQRTAARRRGTSPTACPTRAPPARSTPRRATPRGRPARRSTRARSPGGAPGPGRLERRAPTRPPQRPRATDASCTSAVTEPSAGSCSTRTPPVPGRVTPSMCRPEVMVAPVRRSGAGCGRSAVEADTHPVEEPEVGAAVPADVLAGQRGLGEPDERVAHGLGREGDGPSAYQREGRPLAGDRRRRGRARSARRTDEAPTPSPVYPTAYATRPPIAVPNSGVNRDVVSIAPNQRWVKRSPSSWGKVSRKWVASSAEGLVARLHRGRAATGEVVDRVVPAPQDAAVAA